MKRNKINLSHIPTILDFRIFNHICALLLHHHQVATLLRLASFPDHLFVLNHVLRCPAGVGRWAQGLVQLPALSPTHVSCHQGFGGPNLDYVITALATVLLPPKYVFDYYVLISNGMLHWIILPFTSNTVWELTNVWKASAFL